MSAPTFADVFMAEKLSRQLCVWYGVITPQITLTNFDAVVYQTTRELLLLDDEMLRRRLENFRIPIFCPASRPSC
jgi:hypothetical protein